MSPLNRFGSKFVIIQAVSHVVNSIFQLALSVYPINQTAALQS